MMIRTQLEAFEALLAYAGLVMTQLRVNHFNFHIPRKDLTGFMTYDAYLYKHGRWERLSGFHDVFVFLTQIRVRHAGSHAV